MKLLAACNNEWAVFSVSHYDCRGAHGLMADGGQPGCQNYAGYTRSSHQMQWIELPNVTFADLTHDYNTNRGDDRKYGVHPLSEVRILSKDEIPDTQTLAWRAENASWGTYGVHGDEPLKVILLREAETDHLNAILASQRISKETQEIITYILLNRK